MEDSPPYRGFLLLICLSVTLLLAGGVATGDTPDGPAAGTASLATVRPGMNLFPDTDAASAAGRAIHELKAVGVLEGYHDGSFRPGGFLKRSEAAKILATLAGVTLPGRALGGASGFTDVPGEAWYSGYVAAAVRLGLMRGYDQGTCQLKNVGYPCFLPDGEMRQNEAITVLLRILGYDDRLDGDWPLDYIVQAATLGAIDAGNFIGGGIAPVTREELAVYAYRLLEEDFVRYDGSGFQDDPRRASLGADYLGRGTAKGVLVDEDDDLTAGQTIEEAVGEAAEQAVEEAVEEAIKEPVEGPVEEPVEEPVEKAVGEAATVKEGGVARIDGLAVSNQVVVMGVSSLEELRWRYVDYSFTTGPAGPRIIFIEALYETVAGDVLLIDERTRAIRIGFRVITVKDDAVITYDGIPVRLDQLSGKEIKVFLGADGKAYRIEVLTPP